jgi:hypothetical protein
MTLRLCAFIDEAGQRSRSMKSSAHFIMSAAIMRPEDLGPLSVLLANLRQEPAPACPRCGSTDLVPISCGYPTSESGEAEKRGEVDLGGSL